VVIPLSTQHYMMLRRNLVYTAITRGKKLVVLVGQHRALRIAVKDSRAERRRSKLGRWLSERDDAVLTPHLDLGTRQVCDCDPQSLL
jgi:ATP-dependent exoDNAse (exonuclease V) alpha subunit